MTATTIVNGEQVTWRRVRPGLPFGGNSYAFAYRGDGELLAAIHDTGKRVRTGDSDNKAFGVRLPARGGDPMCNLGRFLLGLYGMDNNSIDDSSSVLGVRTPLKNMHDWSLLECDHITELVDGGSKRWMSVGHLQGGFGKQNRHKVKQVQASVVAKKRKGPEKAQKRKRQRRVVK